MAEPAFGTCRDCGQGLIRSADGRVYHPWNVTGSCGARKLLNGEPMADVDEDAFVPLRGSDPK